jgi:hypothetical protein
MRVGCSLARDKARTNGLKTTESRWPFLGASGHTDRGVPSRPVDAVHILGRAIFAVHEGNQLPTDFRKKRPGEVRIPVGPRRLGTSTLATPVRSGSSHGGLRMKLQRCRLRSLSAIRLAQRAPNSKAVQGREEGAGRKKSPRSQIAFRNRTRIVAFAIPRNLIFLKA